MFLSEFKVITDYSSSYPNHLKVSKAQIVQVEDRESKWPGWIWCIDSEGIGSWVPDKYLRSTGDQDELLCD